MKNAEAKKLEIARQKTVTGGYIYDRMYTENEIVFMYIEDAELDPIRVNFVSGGGVMFDSEQFSYAMLTESMLKDIARSIKYAEAIYNEMELGNDR